MNQDEGIIREYLNDQLVSKDKGLVDLIAGQIVSFKDCYFMIVNVDIAAQELILKPMPKKEAIEQLLKSQMSNLQNQGGKNYC